MRILILNSSDLDGGAARAVYRIHKGLCEIGIDSVMLVQNKLSNDESVVCINSRKEKLLRLLRPKLDQLPLKFYPKKSSGVFSTGLFSNYEILRTIEGIKPDFIHLHWINNGFISINQLKKLDKPLIWSLLDMWAFTGGCHYDADCGKYTSSCQSCPILGSGSRHDLSSYIFFKKKKVYKNLPNLTIVGHSRWLTECARNSTLFKDKRVENIPGLIDTAQFNPIDQKVARKILGIGTEKKIILFGAMSSTIDPRKGFKQIIEALGNLNKDFFELMIFGGKIPEDLVIPGYKVNIFERVYDNITLKLLYSAADVTVVPSLQENLSNVILESLACGTPVVGFNIGGNPDMIDHKMNGYLAKPFDSRDLGTGIDWVINYKDQSFIKTNSEYKIINTFSVRKVANAYKDLYLELIH